MTEGNYLPIGLDPKGAISYKVNEKQRKTTNGLKSKGTLGEGLHRWGGALFMHKQRNKLYK